MNRRNHAYTMWNTDFYGWQESNDPLYRTIPFFLGLHKGTAYGVFFIACRTLASISEKSRLIISLLVLSGELNYYFLAGPEPKKGCQQFTALVGRTPLPPLWSLGYNQCRYSYFPEARARESSNVAREKDSPGDIIYLTSTINRATPRLL